MSRIGLVLDNNLEHNDIIGNLRNPSTALFAQQSSLAPSANARVILLMKGRNYRSPSGQAFTRMKYIHGSPAPKVSKFNMGDLSTHFARKVHLVAREHVQIRHNALESARVSANKVLTDRWGETGYRLQMCVYPHIILRENKMIATAGADRLQEGMRRAFGKPTGRAARVENGQDLFIIYVPEDGVDTAKKALEVAGTKMPMKTRIIVEEPVAPQIPAGA